jgi:DNA repair protein RAD16
MMLRRTKLERADDLSLPPRTLVVRRDYFSAAEKELYLSLFTNAARTFDTYIAAGTVLNNCGWPARSLSVACGANFS